MRRQQRQSTINLMSEFEFELSRSIRRKTLSIVVRRGKVKVMAPVFLSRARIDQFVANKTPWIVQKLQSQQLWSQQNEQQKKQFIEGEMLLYMGLSYPLQLCKGSKSGVELADGHIKVTVSSRVKPENENSHIKKSVQDWYKQQLSQYLCHRTDYFAEQISVAPTQVIVKSYKRRWGSCNSNGLLSFNYLLMMAPAWVIDYVIVHELCHLIHMNHSAHFWAEVNRYYPEHQQAKQWLKVEGGGLYV